MLSLSVPRFGQGTLPQEGELALLGPRRDQISKELEIHKDQALAPLLDGFLKGTAHGHKDMESHKQEYDQALLRQEYRPIKAYVLELQEPPR